MDEIGQIVVHRMHNLSECIKPYPFAITLYQKTCRTLRVLLAGRFIDVR